MATASSQAPVTSILSAPSPASVTAVQHHDRSQARAGTPASFDPWPLLADLMDGAASAATGTLSLPSAAGAILLLDGLLLLLLCERLRHQTALEPRFRALSNPIPPG